MSGTDSVWRRGTTLTLLALCAFAANSILCRKALAQTDIDPALFTLVRLFSGAVMLGALTRMTGEREEMGGSYGGSWPAALALLAYAACFSFAYVSLAAGSGALLLFGAVQSTMIISGLIGGERLSAPQWVGLLAAMSGLTALMLPGATAPPLLGSLLMVSAGMAWGAYSLLGRAGKQPALSANAGNFLRAALLALPLAAAARFAGPVFWDRQGMICAVLSGAVASGIGYAIWYAALPRLRAATAASVQLSVPVITALSGALLLGEAITLRLAVTSLVVLGGIGLVVLARYRD